MRGGGAQNSSLPPGARYPRYATAPIPVPIHWREEVKAALDQDVRLRVIEQVPVGEPVNWCYRMVICPKKNGKPRHTVDFQPLKTDATRETHHTQSPFHQARSVPHGRRRRYSMHGMVIIVFHCIKMIAIIQHSSHLGVDTDTALHHRDILPLEMDTRDDTIKLLHTFHGKLDTRYKIQNFI